MKDEQYERIINKMKKDFNDDTLVNIDFYLKYFDTNYTNINTRKTYLCAYKHHINSFLSQKIVGLIHEQDKIIGQNLYQGNQKNNIIKWSDVEKTLNNIEQSYHNEPKMEKLVDWSILSLYSYMPPRRNADYRELYINDSKKNSIIFFNEKCKLNIVDYKTKDTYGKFEHIIDDPKFNKIFRMISKEKYLLWMFTAPAWTKKISSIFTSYLENSPTNITPNILRHVYITENIHDMDINERQKLAEKMGHSMHTQMTYSKHKESE